MGRASRRGAGAGLLLVLLAVMMAAVVQARAPHVRHRIAARPALSARALQAITRDRARVARGMARRGLELNLSSGPQRSLHAGWARARAAEVGGAAGYIGVVTDLGTIGGTASHAGAVDVAGDVAGDIKLPDGVTTHAAVWPGTCSGCETDLGSLRTENELSEPGPGNSLAKAISPSGAVIAGWSETNSPLDAPTDHQSFRAVTWTRTKSGYTPTDLGTLSESEGTGCGAHVGGGATAVSWATGATDSGVAVGISDTRLEHCPASGSTPDSLFPFFGHAFRYQSGKLEDLGTFDDNPGGPATDCAISWAQAINPAGVVVGMSGSEAIGGYGTLTEGCGGSPNPGEMLGHAFLIPAGKGKGAMQDLGNPAGGTGENNYSEADAINANGELAVNGVDNSGHSRAYLYRKGAFTPLGSLGGATYGFAINSAGVIVGRSYESKEASSHAFAYLEGKLLDLNDILPPGSEWDLEKARGINDQGVIVGSGTIAGHEHAFEMALFAYRVDILTGPTGSTNNRGASFDFSSPVAGGTFECSLDKGAYAACTSPASYSSLADGKHTFSVRAVAPGYPPSEPSTREWTIETQEPQALITSAPSGIVTTGLVTIVWESSTKESGVSYTCELDGGTPYPCASPQKLIAGQAGRHVFKITAVNRFGVASRAPSEADWIVAAGTGGGSLGNQPPATATCTGSSVAKQSSGLLFMVGRSGTCIERSSIAGQPVWQARGPVTVDGIGIIPSAGTVVALSSSSAGVLETTGPCSIRLGTHEPISISTGFTWAQNNGGLLSAFQGAYKEINKALDKWAGGKSPIPAPATNSLLTGLAGLAVPPVWPSIDLSPDNGGTAKITLQVTFPGSFTATPSQTIPPQTSKLDTAGGSIGLTASNENGVRINVGLRANGILWLGPVSIKNPQLSWDEVTETFSGAASLGLAGVKPGPLGSTPELGVEITIGPASVPAIIGCCVEKLSAALQNIDKPLYGPIFLSEIELGAEQELDSVGGRQQTFLKFGGGAAVTVGPKLQIKNTTIDLAALSLKGKVSISTSAPWVFSIGGTAAVLGFPISAAKYTYTNGVGSKLTGNIEATLGGYGFTQEITKAFFQGTDQFEIAAKGTTNWPLLPNRTAQGVFSNNGFAICSETTFLGHSFTLGWGVLADGTQKLFTDVCDFGPFQSTASAVQATAAGTARTIHLTGPAGPRVIGVAGAGGAPELTVEGPGGLHLTTTAAPQAAGLVVPDGAQQASYVVLGNAPAGTYTLSSASVPITSISTSRMLPRVHDTVRTRPLAGGRRRLSFRQTVAPGQELELYEQGGGGSLRLLLTTKSAAGTLVFSPAVGLGAGRQILAVTLNGGLVRHSQSLAPFTVNDSPPPGVVGLTRRGSTVSWRRAPRASRYMAALFAADGVNVGSVTLSGTSLRVSSTSARILVVPVDAIGRPGPASSLTLTVAGKRRRGKRH